MSQAVMDRWSAFVQKLTERMQEIISEAQAGFEAMLEDPDVDSTAFCNAMNAVEIRCKELRTKLSLTYAQQVVLQLGGAAGPAEDLLRRTEWSLFEGFERFRAYFNGQLTRKLWVRVQESIQKPVGCSRCGAPLERTTFHQAESVQCRHCGAVNGVSPEAFVYTYYSLAPAFYAEEQTIESKLGLEQIQLRGATFQELESVARPHWQAYAKASGTILPMGPEGEQRFIESRITKLRG